MITDVLRICTRRDLQSIVSKNELSMNGELEGDHEDCPLILMNLSRKSVLIWLSP